ncbi:hypothetical protein BDL97_02G065500 [Sphagnum fallax]|nr:hypothetical protein BDL97_02G065500 [Sphagnum fallax]
MFSDYIISVFEAVRVYTPSIKVRFIRCRGKSVNLQGSLEELDIVLRMDVSLDLVGGVFLKRLLSAGSSAEFNKNLCHATTAVEVHTLSLLYQLRPHSV